MDVRREGAWQARLLRLEREVGELRQIVQTLHPDLVPAPAAYMHPDEIPLEEWEFAPPTERLPAAPRTVALPAGPPAPAAMGGAPIPGRPVAAPGGAATGPLPRSGVPKPEARPAATAAPARPALPATAALPAPPPRPVDRFRFLRSTEFWLNKVGIALLLLGVAFLFKYSIDQGWLGPPVRVACGLAIGAILLVCGLRLYEDRPHFGQVLLGGSVGTFYITGFAAFQLFHLPLVPFEAALAFMVGVTVLAFVLAVRQDAALLALIGTAGGLATPFILDTGGKNLPGLVLYTCLLLLGTGAIYFYRGWHSLLWTAFVGGWGVFGIAVIGLTLAFPTPALGDRVAVVLGLGFGWLLFGALPVLRHLVWAGDPARWAYPRFDALADLVPARLRARVDPHVHLLAVLTPLVALNLAAEAVPLDQLAWGWVVLIASGVYALAARYLREREARLAYTHSILAVLLCTLALVLLLDGDVRFFALAAEATVLHLVARRLGDRGTALGAHLLSLGAGAWLAVRLMPVFAGPALDFSASRLTDLAVIALLLGVSTRLESRTLVAVYRFPAHLAVFAWLAHTFVDLPAGDGYAVLAGVLYASLLHLLAQPRGDRGTPRPLADPASTLATHLAFAAAGVWIALRLATGLVGDPAMFNTWALPALAVIALAFGVSRALYPAEAANVYRLCGHLAALGWLGRELLQLDGTGNYVLLAWAVYALLLQVLGRRTAAPGLGELGHGLCAVVAAWVGLRLLLGHPLVFGLTSGLVTLGSPGAWPIFNAMGLTDLAVILLLGGLTLYQAGDGARLVYQSVVYQLVIGWLWRELSVLEHGGDYVILAWALDAAAVLLLLHRRADRGAALTLPERGLAWAAHATLAGLLPLLALRMLLGSGQGLPIFNVRAGVDLAVIALALGVSALRPARGVAGAYQAAAHLAILAWCWRESAGLPDGNAYLTVAWGVYGIGVLLAGLWRARQPWLYAGIGTLLLVVGKLFLVDLIVLDPIWRILLFLGFGGLFLVLSYHLQSWLRHAPEPVPGVS